MATKLIFIRHGESEANFEHRFTGQSNAFGLTERGHAQAQAAAEWLERSAALIKYEGNSHVAEPIASALDACFGGNPVEQVDNLISDTIKDARKEGCNE